MRFGEFLTAARESIGLKAEEMAFTLNVHRSTYRRWERGLTTPHQDEYIIRETVRYMVESHREKMNKEWERLLGV
jgi:DNA-binding transcriptional regulator YiaG